MTKGLSPSMTEPRHDTDSPLKTWETWPMDTMKKGDIVRVSWSYDGVHGPMWQEDTYLLTEIAEKKEESETWNALIVRQSSVNGEEKTGQFRQITIHSDDFKNEIDGDWQRIALLVRAEEMTQ